MKKQIPRIILFLIGTIALGLLLSSFTSKETNALLKHHVEVLSRGESGGISGCAPAVGGCRDGGGIYPAMRMTN